MTKSHCSPCLLCKAQLPKPAAVKTIYFVGHCDVSIRSISNVVGFEQPDHGIWFDADQVAGVFYPMHADSF